jgi:hypothetical protein
MRYCQYAGFLTLSSARSLIALSFDIDFEDYFHCHYFAIALCGRQLPAFAIAAADIISLSADFRLYFSFSDFIASPPIFRYRWPLPLSCRRPGRHIVLDALRPLPPTSLTPLPPPLFGCYCWLSPMLSLMPLRRD